MVPLRARAPKGERAFGRAPKNWDNKNVTLISSISLEGMGASMSIEGSADGQAFLLYGRALPVPDAKAGTDRGYMDNLQVGAQDKKGEGADCEECGCQLVFLPSYSPDFNPLEEAFSKVKTLLRKVKARSFEALSSKPVAQHCRP